MSNRARLLGITALALFVLSLVFRKGDLAWMALLILAYLGVGLFQSPSEEGLRLSFLRSAKKLKRDEVCYIEVTLRVSNDGKKTVSVSVADPIQGAGELVEGSRSLYAALRPGAEEEMRYLFEARRGSYDWRGVGAKVGDPFGLFEVEVEVDPGRKVLVQPRIERIRPLYLRPRHTLSSPGPVPTRRGGSGTEFWGVREYQQGDPLRLLDWRLTARHPHRFFTREFVEEKTAEVTLILDGREGSIPTESGESLFEIEARAAASICEMLLRQGQRVGLIVAGKRTLRALPDFGRIQLHRIQNCLAMAEVGTTGAQTLRSRLSLSKLSRKSTLVIMSPVDSGDLVTFRRLKAMGFEVVLICPDLLDLSEPALVHDRVGDLAHRAVKLERRIPLIQISQLSVTVIDWRVGESLWPRLRGALRAQARRRGS